MSRLRSRSRNRDRQESCPGDPGAAKARPRFLVLLLALVTLLAYLPAARNGFLIYDDNTYVTDNRTVQNGLTWAGIQWAFTTGFGGNWHPLTWLSHMADCEWFGLNAGAQHSVNVLFHATNVVLLFLLLLRLTQALWPAVFIAALFAWHPLHVESVAWISERKDVLSTFFALLALLAYARYAQKRSRVEDRGSRAGNGSLALGPRPSTLDYTLALLCFAFGLMAKPMLVTLPFVMLLLDYWPLQRFNPPVSGARVRRLVLEKTPFFLLTAISCVVTFLAQRHGEAVMTLQKFSLAARIENALVAYEQYLVKMIWPAHLAVFYPLPKHFSGMQVMAAVVVLAVISGLVWQARRRSPWLLVGWLWFLGTLVPVIGLVQVGSAALADRYTYFPLVGLFIAVAFGARELIGRWAFLKIPAAIAAGLALAACLALTENQLRYWHDSESLFTHAIAVTEKNSYAINNYGVALELEGRLTEALDRYQEAVRLTPDNARAQYNVGNLLDKMGRTGEARQALLEAIRINPDEASLHSALGQTLVELGRFDEARKQFTAAAQLDPASPGAIFEIGRLDLKRGKDADALERFHEALRLDPDNFQILAYTAHVLATDDHAQIRDGNTALELAARANVLTGGSQPLVLDALGMAAAETGDFEGAQQAAQKAIDLAAAAKMKMLDQLQERLACYQNHRPWRESFLATNAPANP
jgi:tetratricopeptide (TPR) repeat protein